MTPIREIGQIPIPSMPEAPTISPSGQGFADILADSIKSVEQASGEASKSVEKFISGETDDLHRVALSAQRAELSSELFLQVRNKIVQAYQEIMRMQM